MYYSSSHQYILRYKASIAYLNSLILLMYGYVPVFLFIVTLIESFYNVQILVNIFT